jgi:hypothetical protein
MSYQEMNDRIDCLLSFLEDEQYLYIHHQIKQEIDELEAEMNCI